MEYFDLLTSEGHPTGEVKERALVHRDGDWHQTVHIWVVNERSEILLQLRSPNKDSRPNMWDVSVGGHIAAGDTPALAAQRELKEELGLSASGDDLEYLFLVRVEADPETPDFVDNEFNEVYLFRTSSDQVLHLQGDEVADAKYFTLSEFQKLVLEHPEEIVDRAEEYARFIEIFSQRIVG